MSCIYGPRQLGTEDQGWLAHFFYCALELQAVTIYGDGCQVRDILHVHDLVDAMERVASRRDACAGQVYNVGGGLAQAISVRQALAAIEARTGRALALCHAAARPGDQQIYISDTAKLSAQTGWRAQRSLDAILADIAGFWHSDLKGHRARTIGEPAAQEASEVLVGQSRQGYVA